MGNRSRGVRGSLVALVATFLVSPAPGQVVRPRKPAAVSPSPVVQPRPPSTLPQALDLWQPPQVQSCPASGLAGQEIEIRGRSLGNPAEPQRTRVLFEGWNGTSRVPLAAGVRVPEHGRLLADVPQGALNGSVWVETPGGRAPCPNRFYPLYLLHFPPNAFAADGPLNYLHMYDCRLRLAHGQDKSIFLVSPEMKAFNFNDIPLTMEPFTQRVDLGIAKTTFRVRIPGSNPNDAQTAWRATAFDFRFDGPNCVVRVPFENQGYEQVGEYETQDLLTGRIHWKHFMNVDVNNLVLTVTIPLLAGSYRDVAVGEVAATASFNVAFNIFGSPPFTVDQKPITDYLKSEVEGRARAALNSDAFRLSLAQALTAFLRQSPNFSRVPFSRFELTRAGDGGLDVRALNP